MNRRTNELIISRIGLIKRERFVKSAMLLLDE